MTQRMLIDATQPEETRVVVHNGDRIEDFDYETASKKQLKGNIYLAKVTRVEPSLQAAFVEYGGNRHGFLPFSEIHPDYYRIPIADREALMAAEKAALRAEDDDDHAVDDDEENSDAPRGRGRGGRKRGSRRRGKAAKNTADDSVSEAVEVPSAEEAAPDEKTAADADSGPDRDAGSKAVDGPGSDGPEVVAEDDQEAAKAAAEQDAVEDQGSDDASKNDDGGQRGDDEQDDNGDNHDLDDEIDAAAALHEVESEEKVDSIGGDEVADAEERRAQLLRRYKIQEVIKRRQILLIQVTKEERGNKGAALTTYLSLAGRYCVLMPNTNKGGGISRKISNTSDRRRLKKILAELNIPDGIAVIVRTAGSQRSKAEIRRDYEYLMRLWNEIRESTLKSSAPALIHEEANLIKRAIRDLYNRDMDEIQVEGEEGYKAAKAFMRSLMPSHAKKVQLYKDEVPLFQRYKVERHLDAMHLPNVQLRSGGYIVLNATEALVAIDVNSGKATRERNIEETALKTNLEAAEEVGRQLRLRDLAGLVVIDFIDMEDQRHNREVERKLKEALRSDRARIQLGRISPFGLLEMSRQRLRPSLFESSTALCPHCSGTGHVRTPESAALQVLRNLEEEGLRHQGGELVVTAPTEVALYLLNQKRSRLIQIEERYGLKVQVQADAHISTSEMKVERLGARGGASSRNIAIIGEEASEAGGRRRGRRRGRWSEEPAAEPVGEDSADGEAEEQTESHAADGDERPKKRRRRGKRGGRRRSRRGEENGENGLETAPPPSANDDDDSETSATEETAASGEDTGEGDASESPARPRRRRGGTGRDRRGRQAKSAEREDAPNQDDPGQDDPIQGSAVQEAPLQEDRAEEVSDQSSAATVEAERSDGDQGRSPADETRKTRSSRSRGGRGRGRKATAKPASGDNAQAADDQGSPPHQESPAPEESPSPPTNLGNGETSPLAAGSEEVVRSSESDEAANCRPEDRAPAELEAEPQVAEAPVPPPQETPAQPKKRGWWNKLIES